MTNEHIINIAIRLSDGGSKIIFSDRSLIDAVFGIEFIDSIKQEEFLRIYKNSTILILIEKLAFPQKTTFIQRLPKSEKVDFLFKNNCIQAYFQNLDKQTRIFEIIDIEIVFLTNSKKSHHIKRSLVAALLSHALITLENDQIRYYLYRSEIVKHHSNLLIDMSLETYFLDSLTDQKKKIIFTHLIKNHGLSIILSKQVLCKKIKSCGDIFFSNFKKKIITQMRCQSLGIYEIKVFFRDNIADYFEILRNMGDSIEKILSDSDKIETIEEFFQITYNIDKNILFIYFALWIDNTSFTSLAAIKDLKDNFLVLCNIPQLQDRILLLLILAQPNLLDAAPCQIINDLKKKFSFVIEFSTWLKEININYFTKVNFISELKATDEARFIVEVINYCNNQPDSDLSKLIIKNFPAIFPSPVGYSSRLTFWNNPNKGNNNLFNPCILL